MKKDDVKMEIMKNFNQDEQLVGFFIAQSRPAFWLYFLLGPLTALSMKMYYVGVTNKGVHFHKLNFLGKFSQHDFFSFSEIQNVKVGKGLLQTPMQYTFTNGKKLKLQAQKKGLEHVAKIDDQTVAYIAEHTKAA